MSTRRLTMVIANWTPKYKKIIGGKAYNTETATVVSYSTTGEDGYDRGEFLFETRHGAYFLYSYSEEPTAFGNWREAIRPMSPDEARGWMETQEYETPDHIEAVFGEMPEAGSAEVKFTLRMPESLRSTIETTAKAVRMSANQWIVRTLEAALDPKRST
jgi:hypothetical protein